MSAVHFRVTGRVQGVGFRNYVATIAEQLAVVGEVWNTRDGAVEGYAQGENSETFIALIQNGPGYVANVSTTTTELAEYTGFSVAPTR